jgi:nucleotide-binding universal stress UspA family protein
MTITVLVPLDGSAVAEQAVTVATALVSRENSRLVLVRAVPTAEGGEFGDPHAQRARAARAQQARAAAEAELVAMTERLQGEARSVTFHLIMGDPATAILATAASAAAELIVMTGHAYGRSEQWPCGRVAEAVLGGASIPCVLVPPDARPRPDDRPPRILTTLDDSPMAETMLERMAALLTAVGADLILLRVVEPPHYVVRPSPATIAPAVVPSDVAAAREQLERAADSLRAALGRPIATHVAVGRYPASTIAEVAHEHQADLIALGLRRDAGSDRPPLGSVALDVLALAACPVLLVPAPSADAARFEATGALSLSLSRVEVDVLMRALGGMVSGGQASPTQEVAGELLAHLRELSEV